MSDRNENYRLLLQLHLFLGIGISIVAAVGLSDLLFLRMKFDLSWFGMIRSCMYLFPALCYFAAAPFLKGTLFSREIVQYAYLVRIGIAVLIPVAALFTDNPRLLLIVAAVCTSIAYVAAAFANNTLMVLFRQLLTPEDFNRQNASVAAVFNIASAAASLIGAWILSLASDLPDRSFYGLYILLALTTGLFESQVFRINRKLKMRECPAPEPVHFSYSEYVRQALAGLRSPAYRRLLLIAATACLFTALLDTYVTVYLYKVQNVSAFFAALICNIACFIGNFAGIRAGRWCDRLGYLKLFRAGSLAIVILTLLFGFFQGKLWVAVVYLLFIYGSAGGLLSGAIINLRGAAAARLAPGAGGESYIAAYSLIQMLFSFAGSLLAGCLFTLCRRWADGGTSAAFSLYFKAVGIAGLLILLPLYNRGCSLLDRKRV